MVAALGAGRFFLGGDFPLALFLRSLAAGTFVRFDVGFAGSGGLEFPLCRHRFDSRGRLFDGGIEAEPNLALLNHEKNRSRRNFSRLFQSAPF